MDYRGLALIVAGVGLSVFGFQQSALWGWGNPAIEASIAAGVILLVVFFAVERRTESPLINVRIFENRTFTGRERHPRHRDDGVHPGVLLRRDLRADRAGREGHHVQPARSCTSSSASWCARRSAAGCWTGPGPSGRWCSAARWPPSGSGCGPGRSTDLHVGAQVIYIVMAGAGMGLMLGQANTDAINRASRYSYGEATGITQTVRNYGASLGFAILGTILITEFRSRITSSLTAQGAAGPGRLGGSGEDRPAAGRQRQRRRHPAVHPGRLRRRHPRRAVRDVPGHGRRRRSWRCAASSAASSRRPTRPPSPAGRRATRTPTCTRPRY